MFEIGSSLRDARLRKELDLNQLEAETKIRAKYLRALEEERFDVLPGETYVKGFLRIYAERLGLDGQLYVDEYTSRFALGDEPVVPTRPRRGPRHGRFQTHAVLVALAGIIAVTVLVIAAWKLGTDRTSPPPASTTGAEAVVETASPGGSDVADAAPPPPPVVVALRAAGGASDVVVRRGSASGRLVFEGRLAKGDAEEFRGKRLWVFLARPDHVVLSVDGERAAALEGAEPGAVLVSADGVRPVRP